MSYDGAQYDGFSWDTESLPAESWYDGTQYDGKQWDADPASGQYWVIDNTRIRVTSATLTPTTLSLEVRARSASDRALLRRLDDDAGKYDERTLADGTTEARDTAGGSNTFTVRPSARLRPPRIEREFAVDNVTRRRLSANTQALAGSLSFVARETRASVTGYDNGPNSSWWTFEFNDGTIVTPRVSDISQEGATTLSVILEPLQAELFETVAAATAGAVVAEVPDGQDYARDTTPGNRQTVTITPPDDATDPPIDADDYVVTGWSSSGTDGGAYRVEMDISTRANQ